MTRRIPSWMLVVFLAFGASVLHWDGVRRVEADPPPPCPLLPDQTRTMTIDQADLNVNNATCLDNQANDCGLHGVLGWINDVVPQICSAELANGSLAKAAILINFKPEVFKPEAGPIDIVIQAGQELKLKLPSGLRAIVIDGALPDDQDGQKVKVKLKDATVLSPVLDVSCLVPTLPPPAVPPVDCAGVTTSALSLKNLILEAGPHGMFLDGKKAANIPITLEKVDVLHPGMSGLTLQSVTADQMVLNEVSINDIVTNGIYVQNSRINSSTWEQVRLRGLINAVGVKMDGVTVSKLMIKDGESVGNLSAAYSFMNGSYNGITFSGGNFEYLNYGIYLDSPGKGLLLEGVTLHGLEPTSKASLLLQNLHLLKVLQTVIVKNSRLKVGESGIVIEGHVNDVQVVRSILSDFSTAAISARQNGKEPDQIYYRDLQFLNVPSPVKYSSAAGDAIFFDNVINANKTNLGLDTPLVGQLPKLTRDWQNLSWLRMKYTYLKGHQPQLFWVEGTNSYQLKVDSSLQTNCQVNGICDYTIETALDEAHLPADAPIAGKKLENLFVTLAMQRLKTIQIKPTVSIRHTSMPSAAQTLADVDWLGTEYLEVDNTDSDDAVAKMQCTAAEGDCSLRGAVAYAKARRDAGKTHQIEIRFNDTVETIVLTKAIEVNANKLDIVGGDHGPRIVAGVAMDMLIGILTDHVSLKFLALKGETIAKVLVKNSAQSTQLQGVQFLNVGAGNTAVKNDIVQHMTVIEPKFEETAPGLAIELSNNVLTQAHVTKLGMKGVTLTTDLISGNGIFAPLVKPAILFDLVKMTADVWGTTPQPKQCDTMDAYVSFSKPQYRLEYVGSSQPNWDAPPNDKNYYLKIQLENYAVDLLKTWGEMGLYLVCQVAGVDAGGAPVVYSSNWSVKGVVFNDLNLLDSDGDNIFDIADNAPLAPNPAQEDLDGDGIGDVIDPDKDGDGIEEAAPGSDNCPLVQNAGQENTDGEGEGNACDADDDNDGVLDGDDNCPFDVNPDQAAMIPQLNGACLADTDKDGVPDNADNCANVANADQLNTDGEGEGNACDADDDNDSVPDVNDNSPLAANPDQKDTDGDGMGDASDPDDDNDTVLDAGDNCSLMANPDQADVNNDGFGDVCVIPPPPPAQPDAGGNPPPAGGDNPPVAGGGNPPPAGGDNPPVAGGGNPPPAGGDNPPVAGGGNPPPAGGDNPPVAGGGNPPPAGGDNPPVAGGGGDAGGDEVIVDPAVFPDNPNPINETPKDQEKPGEGYVPEPKTESQKDETGAAPTPDGNKITGGSGCGRCSLTRSTPTHDVMATMVMMLLLTLPMALLRMRSRARQSE